MSMCEGLAENLVVVSRRGDKVVRVSEVGDRLHLVVATKEEGAGSDFFLSL